MASEVRHNPFPTSKGHKSKRIF